jgi:hypothetical protein
MPPPVQMTPEPPNPAGQGSPVRSRTPSRKQPSSIRPVHPCDPLPPTVVVKVMVMDDDVEVTTPVLFTTASWAPGNVVAPSKTRRVSPDATLNVEMRS